jgi:hypothetical protein
MVERVGPVEWDMPEKGGMGHVGNSKVFYTGRPGCPGIQRAIKLGGRRPRVQNEIKSYSSGSFILIKYHFPTLLSSQQTHDDKT